MPNRVTPNAPHSMAVPTERRISAPAPAAKYGGTMWTKHAVVEAARVRLRPIVMTTMCFIHMAPPYFASGAGAEMRRSVGTAMLWGAFGVTLFGIFLTPVFYFVVRWLFDRRQAEAAPALGLETDRNGTALLGPPLTAPNAFHLRNGKTERPIDEISALAGQNWIGD